MTDLDVDTEQLRLVASRIRLVLTDLRTAGTQAHEAANFVGHERLAGKVRDFADAWSIHRGDTINEITTLADLFDAVHQTFTDLDSNTAAELRSATEQFKEAIQLAAAGRAES